MRILKFLFSVTNLFSSDVINSDYRCLWPTAASEIGSSFLHGKVPSNSQGVVKTQLTESSQPSSVPIHNVSSVSRPPSNYSSRSQEIVGSQKGIILDKSCMS